MISFLLLIVCALNFICLINWANKAMKRSFRLGNSRTHTTTTETSTILTSISTTLAVAFGVILVTRSFWGLTDNPYLDGTHKPWIRAGDDLAIFVGLVLCTAIGLSYRFTYLVGKVHGIESWKGTSVYSEWVRNRESEKSDKSTPDATPEY